MKPIETELDQCIKQLKDLNPVFCPWSSVTRKNVLEFRTMLWDNLTGLFKGKLS